MKPVKGYYSLIQYCPDRSKLEAANIGLVMFAPELNFLRGKVNAANNRISKFFGRDTFDSCRINFLKESLQRRLKNEEKYILTFEHFDKFIKTRANELLLTDPRPTKIFDTENPESELDSLYGRLIGSYSEKKCKKTLFPELDSEFRTRLSDRMQFDNKFQITGYNRTIDIPYSYRNGKLNLIHPHEFGPNGVDTGFRLVTEGKLIEKNGVTLECSQEQAKLIILPKVDDKVNEPQNMRKMLKKLFDDFEILSVWEEQQSAFVEKVTQQAHQ